MSDQEAVAAIIRDVNPSIKIESPQYDKPLFDLGLDSLDHSTILLHVEEKFGIKIPDEVAGSLLSVSSIADFVANNRAS